MSVWTEFVKANYHKVAHLPNKERFKALSAMRKGNAKGSGLIGDIAGKVGGIANVFGLGLDMPKKRGRKAKGGMMAEDGGVLTAGSLPKRRMRKAKIEDAHGAGFLSGALGALGL